MSHRNRIDDRPTFGVSFDLVTYDELMTEAAEAVAARRRFIVGYMNLHGAYVRQASPAFEAFLDRADRIYADGAPLMAWRRILWGEGEGPHRFSLTHRLPDFLDFCAEKGWTVFYLGSREMVSRSGLEHLRSRNPSLKLLGHHGFFDNEPASQEFEEVVKRINDSQADVLLVGMGMPVQEKFVNDVSGRISVPLIWTVGAAIEYYSGHVPLAPKWIYAAGLEWIFRLINNPRRLSRRYIVEPLYLLPSVLGDLRARLATGGRGKRSD